jgi:hypothetical protein
MKLRVSIQSCTGSETANGTTLSASRCRAEGRNRVERAKTGKGRKSAPPALSSSPVGAHDGSLRRDSGAGGGTLREVMSPRLPCRHS